MGTINSRCRWWQGTFSLALFQGSQPVTGAVPLPASPATLTLPAGVYTLLTIAEADPTAKAGLYGITVTGPAGVAPLLSASYPVGLLQPAATVKNPSAQSLDLDGHRFRVPGGACERVCPGDGRRHDAAEDRLGGRGSVDLDERAGGGAAGVELRRRGHGGRHL